LISGLDYFNDTYDLAVFEIASFDCACCPPFLYSYSCVYAFFPFSIVFISVWVLIKSVSFSFSFLPLPVINISIIPLAVTIAMTIVVFKLASVGHTFASNILCSIAFYFHVFKLSPVGVTIREFYSTDSIKFFTMVFSKFFLTGSGFSYTSTLSLTISIQVPSVSGIIILLFSEFESSFDRIQLYG
jgi:hypothetical protein